MIGLHAADRTLPRGDLITDFAYNPLKASLYASTVSGNVVMWRLVGTQVRVCRLIVVEPCVCVWGGGELVWVRSTDFEGRRGVVAGFLGHTYYWRECSCEGAKHDLCTINA